MKNIKITKHDSYNGVIAFTFDRVPKIKEDFVAGNGVIIKPGIVSDVLPDGGNFTIFLHADDEPVIVNKDDYINLILPALRELDNYVEEDMTDECKNRLATMSDEAFEFVFNIVMNEAQSRGLKLKIEFSLL